MDSSTPKGRSPPPHLMMHMPQRPQRPHEADPRMDRRPPWDRGQPEYPMWDQAVPPQIPHGYDAASGNAARWRGSEQMARSRADPDGDYGRWEDSMSRGHRGSDDSSPFGHNISNGQPPRQARPEDPGYDNRFTSPARYPSPHARRDAPPPDRWDVTPAYPAQQHWESPRFALESADPTPKRRQDPAERDFDWNAKILQVKQVAASVEQVCTVPAFSSHTALPNCAC
eukprot:2285073-Rhodomonas_salina.1